jgi:hypothetical protein
MNSCDPIATTGGAEVKHFLYTTIAHVLQGGVGVITLKYPYARRTYNVNADLMSNSSAMFITILLNLWNRITRCMVGSTFLLCVQIHDPV